MRRLSCSNDLIRDVSLLIHDHDRPLDPDRISLLRQMQRLARSGVDTARLMGELLDLKRADTLGKASGCFYYVEEIERMREMCRELLANREAYSIKTLDLAGSDLIARGMAPGPRIGEAVEEIERMREMCRELLANREAYSIKTLDLAGSDLIARGMAPGPRIGEALNRALEGAIVGAVANEREALLAYLGF